MQIIRNIFRETFIMLEKYWVYLFITGMGIGAMVAMIQHLHGNL